MTVPKIPLEIETDKLQEGFADVGSAFESLSNRMVIAFDPVNIGMRILEGGVDALTGAIKRATEAAFEQEKQDRRLLAVLKQQTGEYQQSFQRLQQFNSALQANLGIGDEQSQMMETNLALFKIQEDRLEIAMKASIGLAEITGDLTSASRLAARALTGETSALTRYGIQVDNVVDAEKRLLELYEVAEANSDTLARRVKTLEANWGDLWEELGFVITKSELVNEAFDTTAERVKTVSSVVHDNTDATAEFLDKLVARATTAAKELAVIGGALWAPTTLAAGAAGIGALDAETGRRQRKAARGEKWGSSDFEYKPSYSFAGSAVEFGEGEAAEATIESDPIKLMEQRLARIRAANKKEQAAVAAASRSHEGTSWFGIPAHALEEIKSSTDEEIEIREQALAMKWELWHEEADAAKQHYESMREIEILELERQNSIIEKGSAQREAQLESVKAFGTELLSQAASTIGSLTASLIVGAIEGAEAGKQIDEVIGSFVMSFGAYLIQAGTTAMILSGLSLIPGLQFMGGGPAGIAAGAGAAAAGVGMVFAGSAMGGSLTGGSPSADTSAASTGGGGSSGPATAPQSNTYGGIPGMEPQAANLTVNFYGPVGGSRKRIARDFADVLRDGGFRLEAA